MINQNVKWTLLLSGELIDVSRSGEIDYNLVIRVVKEDFICDNDPWFSNENPRISLASYWI